MARRRDNRRFGPGPYLLGLPEHWRDGFPFDVSARPPEANIYELSDEGIATCAYDDLDAVRLTRGFLEDPERYLRAALT